MPIKTFRFIDFKIYKEAKAFRKFINAFLNEFPSDERFRLVNQIHRACQSIILNIAEGSAKKSDKDFRRFLEISIASVSEVVAGFDLAKDDGIISEDEFNSIEFRAENLARQIGGFMKALS